jgi:hypothetical protein
MNFYVGQRVVCVWAPGRGDKGFGWEKHPKVGSTYTIRDLEDLAGDGPGIRLVEIVNELGDYAEGYVEVNFCPTRFRAFEEMEIAAHEAIAETV